MTVSFPDFWALIQQQIAWLEKDFKLVRTDANMRAFSRRWTHRNVLEKIKGRPLFAAADADA
jgi:hypothetical protein